MTAPAELKSSGRLILARTIDSPDGVAETDWAGLQAVPVDVERVEIDPAARATREVFIVAVARTAAGEVVTGTVSMQLVSIDQVGGVTVVSGSVVQVGVATGAGVVLPTGGAYTCTVRVVDTTGLATATTLKIFMRRAS